ncbi:alkane 1-monooxygenase [Caenimonas koreensis DSM 17982]|uniref:Alkane 1-monooxygenase n=1 Tax=Caenimonas koreensis DSM 17982 TaxID=1121255 RepID=A0A844AVT7_9BURK|nr:alkane 1-monooxygenase [Caenimonas koreensis]MRD48505.1 alkane 1-monooxygenase [Caenimonas koreensis DSM 17982]
MARLRLSDARFLLAWLLPFSLLLNLTRHPEQAAIGTLITWAAVAAIDQWWPGAQRSPAAGAANPLLSWVLRLFVPLQCLMLVVGLLVVREGDWWRVLGLSFAVGFVTGAQGITFAHELGHSRNRVDRALGWLLMASVNYSHFMVEHYRGHHPRAATFDDPATARRGETLWGFLPRTLGGSFMSGWRLEAIRLRQFGKSWMASPLAWASGLNVLIVAVFAIAGEWKMLAFWLGQSAFAIWLLETVNYIEHYGLQRSVDADGKRDPFGVPHAWNADHVVSNSLLANLQRHSDHHTHAWKPFPELEPLPGPQLPTGYAGCLLLAAVPPLWFRLMHPRLDAAR